MSNAINLLTSLTGINKNIITDLIARPDQNDIEAALLSLNASKIASTLCVDEKTSKIIAHQMKKITDTAKIDDDIHVNLERYTMRQYRADSFLDEQDKALKAAFESSECYQDMHNALEAWKNLAASRIYEPFQINALAEFVSQPQSIVSDLLKVSYNGHPTDKLAICDHQISIMLWEPETFKQLVPDISNQTTIKNSIKDIKALFVMRLVLSGLVYQNVKMVFFTAAPSQLKKGSCYLMNEVDYKANIAIWWGGLNDKVINDKGGIVTTKFMQQFRALLCTAAAPSSAVLGQAITIDDMVCVKEITTNLSYDNVWNIDAKYNCTHVKMDNIDFSPFDGAGMISSKWLARRYGTEAAKKIGCLQFRAYSCKGLLGKFDIDGYNAEHGCSNKVIDIDGNEVEVGANGKGVLINDTIFKLAKYYGTWQNYVKTMHRLGLTEMYICGIDEEETRNKALSRQSLQTLFDATDEEIATIALKAKVKLERLTSDQGVYEELAEAGTPWDEKSDLAKLVTAMPDIVLMDEIQNTAKDRYTSAYNKIMYGKLPIKGEFHYALPDFSAYCDVLFGGKKLSDPDCGVLKAYQVACIQHDNNGKQKGGHQPRVSLVRYPHAFFEWVNCDVVKNKWFTTNACYFSVHDLCYRILQMDVDGDHVLVIENETIYQIVNRIRNDFHMPVLVYDPTNGGKTKLPHDKKGIAEILKKCIMDCLKTNLVGSYSNLITNCWSKVHRGEDNTDLFENAAIIACGINHAVDSQKTGYLYNLEKWNYDFVQSFKASPYSQRYRDASQDHPSTDEEFWNGKTMQAGLGTVERMERIIELSAPDHLDLDTSDYQPSWKLMRYEAWGNGQIDRCFVRKELREMLERYGNVRLNCKNDGTIGLAEFTAALAAANGAFWASYEKSEDNGIVKQITKEARRDLLAQLYLEVVKTGDLIERRGMKGKTDDELLRWVSNKLVTVFWSKKTAAGIAPEKMPKIRRFVIDNFGGIMAEAVLLNRKLGAAAEPDREAFITPVSPAQEIEEAPYDFSYIPDDIDEYECYVC